MTSRLPGVSTNQSRRANSAISNQKEQVITVQLQKDGTHLVRTPDEMNPGLDMRLRASAPFIEQAVKRFQQMGHYTVQFNIQLHDEKPSKPSFLIDAEANQDWKEIPMIPDFYCMDSRGYETMRAKFKELPTWNERLSKTIWRGSSTGAEGLDEQNIQKLRRYQLCQFTANHFGSLDARFNAIVQTKSSEAESAIREHLICLDLLRPRMDPTLMALHRWIIDIDGNVNSWGLLWKFLSGSCILRIESPRRQWFYNRLIPWETHVPIAEDLHDLMKKIYWCREHPVECKEIAKRGQQMAENVIAAMSHDQDQAIDTYAKKYL